MKPLFLNSRLLKKSPETLPDHRKAILRLCVSSTAPFESISTQPIKLPSFLKFVTACSNLQSLEMFVPGICDDDLWVLCKSCPFLTSLSMVSIPAVSWARITDEGIEAICSRIKGLRSISIEVIYQGAGSPEARSMDQESALAISERCAFSVLPNLTYQRHGNFSNCVCWKVGRVWIQNLYYRVGPLCRSLFGGITMQFEHSNQSFNPSQPKLKETHS